MQGKPARCRQTLDVICVSQCDAYSVRLLALSHTHIDPYVETNKHEYVDLL